MHDCADIATICLDKGWQGDEANDGIFFTAPNVSARGIRTHLCAFTAVTPEAIVLTQRLPTFVAIQREIDVGNAQFLALGNVTAGDHGEAVGAAFGRSGQRTGRRGEFMGSGKIAHLSAYSSGTYLDIGIAAMIQMRMQSI